ncbi:MAG TPA: signal peptidase I [Myxococcaceae bacterium]|nr:signal peptidase I [Myxococcaceae bacterium]
MPRRWFLHPLASPWSPPAAFGAAVVLYLVAVEAHRPSAAWARPLLFAAGAGCLLWLAGLWGTLAAVPRVRRERAARRRAAELIREVGSKLARGGEARKEAVEPPLQQAREALAGEALEPVEAAVLALESSAARAFPELKGEGFLALGWGVAKALALALLIRAVLVEPFRIPTGSMLPTLQIGDQVFVNKLIYGVRIPWLNEVPFVIVRRPGRGDVIVFNNPADPTRDFIKRVVGVPGDTVEIDDEVVRINGVSQPRSLVDPGYVVHNREAGPWYDDPVSFYEESLDGVRHATLQAPRHPHAGVVEGPYVVPEGQVFVMGDNRDGSTDSRYGLGGGGGVRFVPYGRIKGKAMVVWLSLSYGGWLADLFGGTGLRTDRLFLPVP